MMIPANDRARRAAWLLLFLIVPCVGPAHGASAMDEELTEETLLVTAHRVPVPQARAGSSATVVERDLIAARQRTHAADLLQDLPGVAVSRLAGPGSQTQVRIRGAEANQVLVLVDGMRANDPAGSDEFDFAALTAYDIERIEVIRGPQSALWGSDAVAGVINVTTRQGEGSPRGSGYVEGGSHDTWSAAGRFGVGGSSGGVAVSGSYFDTHGENAALVGSEQDGSRNRTVGLNAHWRPTAAVGASFNGRYSDTDVEFDGIDPSTGLPADTDSLSRNELLLLGATGSVSLLNGRWGNLLRLSYLDSRRRQFEDGARQNSTAAETLGVSYQAELELPLGSLIGAADYRRESFEQRGLVLFGDPNQDQERDTLGWVGEYLVTPMEGLDLSASIRRDDNSDFRDATTYRLTGSYRLARSGTRLRASAGSGQKAPTFTELYGFFPDSFVGNPDLDPERSRGYDLGVLQPFQDGRWQLELGYFNERLNDEIVTVFVPGTFFASVDNLSGSSRREGAELELNGAATDSLAVRLSYTYTDSEESDGVREVRRPRHMAALNLDQQLLAGRAGINLNLSYTGSQLDDVFLPPTFAPRTERLDDYMLVDLAGRLRLSPRLTLTLRAENLLDEHYLNVVGYRTPGRALYLGLRLDVGS